MTGSLCERQSSVCSDPNIRQYYYDLEMINRMAREPFSHSILTGVALGAVLGVIFGWGEGLSVFAWTFLAWCAGGAAVYAFAGATLGRSRPAPREIEEDPQG